MELHFTNLLIVTAAGFAAPFTLGFVPALRLPSIVLELVLGIVLGRQCWAGCTSTTR